MSARHLVWAVAAATAGLALATVGFGFADDGTRLPADEGGDAVSGLGDLAFGIMIVAFGLLGALLAARRPRNPIGWMLCVSPLALGVSGAAGGWYIHASYAAPGSQPPPEALLWVANWIWVLGFIPLITALLLLFPDGRLPSPRWWPAALLVGVALGALALGHAFEPGKLENFPRVGNPLATSGALGDANEFLKAIGFPFLALAAFASAAALVSRFRHAHGVERQQLRWMAAAAAVAVFAWTGTVVLDEVLGVSTPLLPTVLLTLPAAATVAILRYRLYDLGLVVNRTLVYGALTLMLGGAYLALVLLAGLAVGRSDLAVAVSTLAVAGLFRPLRTRIQAVVDRRFYRRRYDAAQTLESFSGRLRDEVDLEALSAELRAVVGQTMQPTEVTLWLRP